LKIAVVDVIIKLEKTLPVSTTGKTAKANTFFMGVLFMAVLAVVTGHPPVGVQDL